MRGAEAKGFPVSRTFDVVHVVLHLLRVLHRLLALLDDPRHAILPVPGPDVSRESAEVEELDVSRQYRKFLQLVASPDETRREAQSTCAQVKFTAFSRAVAEAVATQAYHFVMTLVPISSGRITSCNSCDT